MSAIVGLDIDQVTGLVDEAAQLGAVAVANHNSAQQIVITGSPEAVTAAGQIASARGARAIPLKVSGAWHSPLIQGAVDEFTAFLDGIDFQAPACDLIHNVTAATESEPKQIRALMARQLCSSVRWFDSVMAMIAQEMEVFVEIGPGRVLSGLLKKIVPKESSVRLYNVFDLKTLERFVQAEG